jgi:hypothetical protein
LEQQQASSDRNDDNNADTVEQHDPNITPHRVFYLMNTTQENNKNVPSFQQSHRHLLLSEESRQLAIQYGLSLVEIEDNNVGNPEEDDPFGWT